ncbi:MAG: Ldh family oxidoreductase, partial [Chloroflexota bacterium]
MSYQRFSIESLHELARQAMTKVGASPGDAETFATGLVAADARGIESHGVARLDAYANQVERGFMDPKAQPEVVRDAPATALVDAHNGIGHVASTFAMRLAMDKARQAGIGWVVVIHSNHYGIAGYYARMALERDLIGICLTNSGPVVAPTFGREKLLGTNPIALAAPSGSQEPFLLDMATSTVAGGKLQIALWEGKPVPKGWGLDAAGLATTDPAAILKEGAMLALGSFPELSSYKGYGLSMMVEILTDMLGGAPFGMEAGNLSLTEAGAPSETSHLFAAIDVSRFIPIERFKARMDE